MQKSLMNLLGIAALTWSAQSAAVSMGAINVSSALGEPLQAKINLEAVSDSERAELTARLASPEAYKLAGLEFPAGVSFKFTVSEDGKTIQVSSDQAINAPFVSLLVELTWASGKLQRDYTFLVDPAGYSPEQPRPTEVQTIAPDAGSEDFSPPVQRRPIVEAAPASGKKKGRAARVTSDSVTVNRGDTLGKVAASAKPANVSLERMIVALYRVNADRFDGRNMNRIKAGTVLRMPSQEEIDSVSQGKAKQEMVVQAKDWHAYRQRLSNTGVQQAERAPATSGQQSSSGKIGATVTDKTPAAPANPNGTLRLSSGDAPTGKTATAQDKQNAKQEDAIAGAKAARNAQEQAAVAAKGAADAQHLLELKSQLAAASAALASAPASATNVVSAIQAINGVASEVPASGVDLAEIGMGSAVSAAASAIKPPKPVVAAKKPVPPPPETSLLDDAFSVVEPVLKEVEAIDPLYVAGGLGALALVGGAAFVIRRRREEKAEEDEIKPAFAAAFSPAEEDEEEEETSFSHPPQKDDAPPVPQTPFYPGQNTGSFHTPLQETEDEEDPIEEARLFLSFGRDVQAEDILKDALQKNPNNHQIHLELLGIYANRKDVNAFAAIAHQLRDAGDETIWAQAAALGRKLEPSNALYLREGEQADIRTQQIPAFSPQATSPMIDFDIGAFTSKRPAAAPGNNKVDVNIASATAENPALTGESTGKGSVVFDVTSMHPTIPPTQAFKADPKSINMDFTMPEIPAMTPEIAEATPVSDLSGGIEFALPDLHLPGSAAAEADPLSSFGSGGIDFAPSASLSPTSAPDLSASALNAPLNIDFAPASPVGTATGTSTALNALSTGGIDFALPEVNLPDTAPAATASFNDPLAGMNFDLPDLSANSRTDKTLSGSKIDFAMPDLASLTANMPALDVPPTMPDIGSITGSNSMKLDFGGLNLNIGGETTNIPIGESTAAQSISNKLDLARVYIDMDDPQSAKEFLEEVMREGSPDQQASAQAMLKEIS